MNDQSRFVSDAEAFELEEMIQSYGHEKNAETEYPVSYDEAKRLIASRAALLEAIEDIGKHPSHEPWGDTLSNLVALAAKIRKGE